MKMKNIVAMIIALSLVLLIVSCSNNKTESVEKSINKNVVADTSVKQIESTQTTTGTVSQSQSNEEKPPRPPQ